MGPAAEALEKLYREWSPGSARLMGQARRVMPGGDTRATAHFPPYPLFVREGRGCRIRDVDGHELLDFMNNFTSLIHGHAHAPTVRAVRDQIERGSAYAAPTESQVALATELCARVPSVEELRFTSCGSEATNMCIRAARAWTGRPRVMKVEGGYHGSHEIGELSLVPLPGKAGPPDAPEVLAPDRSILGGVLDDVVVTPFNAPEVTRAQLERHGDEIAALILEPMLGGMGMIPPPPRLPADAARALRRGRGAARLRRGRHAPAGSGRDAGTRGRPAGPDLDGEIIGGGLPIGAFGGRRDLIEQFSPEARGTVMHGSTFSGNPLSMAAGLAAQHLGLLRRGVFGAGSLMYCTSTAMQEADVDAAVDAFAEALCELRDVAVQDVPHQLL